MKTWKELIKEEMEIFNDKWTNIISKTNITDNILNSNMPIENSFIISTPIKTYIGISKNGKNWISTFNTNLTKKS